MQIWPELISLVQAMRLRGDVDVGVGRDDHRALAAELEGDRGQVRRRALVDLAADLGAAGEAQLVEALRDELLADRAVALDDRDRVGVQVARHQLGHQRRRRRRDLGRLEHDGVARGDGADGGPERQGEREVPRADDSTVPNGSYSIQPRPGSCDNSSSRCLRLVHLPTFLAASCGFARGAGDVGQPRLERLAAEVLLRARRRWRARCRPSAAPAPAAAACATRRRGCGRWRTSCAAGRRRPGCRLPTVELGAADGFGGHGESFLTRENARS